MLMREEWAGVDLAGEPGMLVGWRGSRRRLDALRVKLQEDVFGELAELCRPAVSRVQTYAERPFESFAELDDEQYFWYGHALLPKHPVSDDLPTQDDDTADLVRLVKEVDGLEDATRADLDEPKFSFYAICWPHLNSKIGFVSKMNPIATLKPGIRYFQYGDVMRTADRPDFALREGSDLVIGAEGTAIFSSFSFRTLLQDVGVSFEHVQKDMATVRKALDTTISLTPGADEALLAEASRTLGMAKHLRMLPTRLEAITLTADRLRGSLERHGIDASLILDENDQFSFDERNVATFFDAIESRYFEDDLGGEGRRADRFSTRQSSGSHI